MTVWDRIYLYNQWFDRLPQQQQFLAAFWSALGGLGVILTLVIFIGIPFWLLALATLVVVMGPRVLFKFNRLPTTATDLPPRDTGGETHISVKGRPWVYDLNARYEAYPEQQRYWAVAGLLVAVLVVNVILQEITGFPVGLLVAIAVVAIGWARVVHVQGWLAPRPVPEVALHPTSILPAGAQRQIESDSASDQPR